MKDLPDFTEKSFLILAEERRHKKCAELLREIYERLLNKAPVTRAWSLYTTWLSWLKMNPVIDIPLSAELVSDRYHEHLKLANRHLKEHNLLPQVRTQDKPASHSPWPVYVYLDNIRSAHNVGSILRTAEAFAFGGVYFSSKTPSVDHRQVQQTAMGCAQWIPCHRVESLEELPKPLLVLETSDQAHCIYHYPFPERFTLAMGNEEYGCSASLLQRADAILDIPLRGRKNSLNVANAFAIAASEINRVRTCRGPL